MLSERVYRWLLFVYPRRHRLEYGELMAQLFRDRIRRDGGGLRTLHVWLSIIPDLAGSAWREHRQDADMAKRMSKDRPIITIHCGTKIYSPSVQTDNAEVATADVLGQAVQEGALDQATADELARAYSELPDEARAEPGEPSRPLRVSVWISSRVYTFDGADSVGTNGLDDALRQAVQDGKLFQEQADHIVRSFEAEHTPGEWRHYTLPADGSLPTSSAKPSPRAISTRKPPT